MPSPETAVIRRLTVLACLLAVSWGTLAQTNDQLLNRALKVLETLTQENQALWERVEALERNQGQAGGGGRAVVEGPWILRQNQKSVNLGRFDMCALVNADEHCQCAVERTGNGGFRLKKYEENFVECICGAMCFRLE